MPGTPIPNFAASGHCRSRGHCLACRTDPDWRVSVGAPFECPHGVTVDDLPPVVDLDAVLAEHLAVCKACGDKSCSITHQTECRRRAVLGQEHFHCPYGRF